MNKSCNVLLALVFPLALFSQQFPWEKINLTDFSKTEKRGVTERGNDFYVVDSVYCLLFDDASQTDVPTTRQYNLAFSDDNGNVLENISQNFETASGIWQNSIHEISVYDNGNNLIQLTKQTWDTTNQLWVNDFKTTNTPNENGDFTAVLNQQWHVPSNSWHNLDRLNLSYNQNGFIQGLEQEVWDTVGMVWDKKFRIVYAVTPAGQVGTTVFQLFVNGVYKSISKEVYSFDPVLTHLEIERVAEVWNDALLGWDRSSRILKEYDSNENLTTETHQLWYAPDSTWANNNRFLRNYNANGDVTFKTDLIWNGQQWDNFFQTKNTYDSVFNLTRFEVFQWVQGAWLPLNSCDFYWRFHHEIAASSTETLDFGCVFPNPFKIGAQFRCPDFLETGHARLSIFDLSGKMVYSKMVDNQNFINIAQPIPTGLYVINISNENGHHFSKKIVIVE